VLSSAPSLCRQCSNVGSFSFSWNESDWP